MPRSPKISGEKAQQRVAQGFRAEIRLEGIAQHPGEKRVRFEGKAVEEILRATERYPYFLQEWGFHAWNASPQSTIRRADVMRATPQIIEHLDANFFRVRFDRLTPLQQKYLRAMAELGPGPHKTGDIAP